MLNLHNGYKDNFCKYPKIIDARNGKVSYFDRNIQRMVTISFSNAGGKLKLYSISSSPAPGSVAYSTPKGCGNSSQWANKNKTNVVNNTTTNPDFKVGDYVAVRFSNGTFNGTVKSVRADKLYVDFEKVQDMWVYKRYSKKIEKSNTSTTSSEEFKVGDRVKVEFRGKQFFEGTVKAVDNRNQKIYVDFERIKDMWVWQKFSTKVK
jgi:transcription antitermination factor NusG